MMQASRALSWACSLAAATLLAATSSYALPPPQVGVAAEEPDSPSRERLVDELVAQGFHVRDLHPDDDDEAGQAWGLSAKLVVGERQIRVRIIRRNGDRVERRDATIDMGQTDEERATAAMRAVEFLRASLIEVGWSTAPELPPPMPLPSASQAAALPAPRPTPARPPSANEAVVLGMGGGMVHSTGGFRPNVVFAPSLSLGFLPSAGMRLGVAVPVTAPAVKATEGDASIRPSLFGISAWWAPFRSDWAKPYLEGGVGLFFVSITARSSPGYLAMDKTSISAMPFGGLGISLLPGRTHLRLGAITGPGLRRERVRFVGREVAKWGGWVTEAQVSLEVGLD